jgi:uncharacterized repeat protein (TIGR01451 family)
VSRLQSRRHLYYLRKYFQLVGLTIIGVAQVSAVSAIDTPPQLINKAQYTYDVDASGSSGSSGSSSTTIEQAEKTDPFTGEALSLSIKSNTNQLINNQKLVDPAGGITGCNGEILPSYEGFVVGLYQTPDRLKLGNLVALTPTEVPDIPNNGIPEGVSPNGQNSNPFALTVGNVGGQYNFLLDRSRGQQNPGQSYILDIKPPAGSIYGERQVLLDVVSSNTSSITFNVTSLDSQALSGTSGGAATQTITTPTQDISTSLSVLGLTVGVCNSQTVQIIKSADRASAEPGDTVVYRLVLKNLSTVSISNPTVTDTLPLGFQLQPNAVKARQDNIDIPVTVTQNGNVVTFNFPGTLNASKTINVAYATTLTPDAVRGSGRNSATLVGIRGDNNTSVKDGPAIHQLQVRQGILTDTGTIIGRVFVDKNFDGEQQANEPGIPNAVIFLDDGNKVTTDANGMFSVKGAANGYRTGVLDLSSLPGYTLAPNLYVKERNSQSRLVKLAPSGLVRMNFGVTPTAREAK